ncbi:MAG TPA: DinB family protein [Vicinamibacterales bacterium]|nr:DinB family protein [Vicinamibacterales bacterium]
MRTLLVACACIGLSAAQSSPAPQAPPAAADPTPVEIHVAYAVKTQYEAVRRLMTALADKMPAEHYAFQPTPEVKTFAASLAHIVSSNVNQCGVLVGRKHELAGQDLSKTMTTKEPLVQAVRQTFAFCDEYFNTLTDNGALTGKAYDSFTMRDGQRVPAKVQAGAAATSFLSHNNEMYGYMAVYLRLKGIVPPSSEPRK